MLDGSEVPAGNISFAKCGTLDAIIYTYFFTNIFLSAFVTVGMTTTQKKPKTSGCD